MKMRLESLVHAARQRYGAWAAIFTFSPRCARSPCFPHAMPGKLRQTPQKQKATLPFIIAQTMRQVKKPTGRAPQIQQILRNTKHSSPCAPITARGCFQRRKQNVPLYCIETPLSSLTEEDRRLLARGIRAETLSEACKLIEDYE